VIGNPELQRHVWLELPPARALAMPLVLGLAFGFVYVAAQATGADGPPLVARTALWTFGGLVLVWGTRLAADSLADEIRSRTWDAQRMSALPAWTLTWGKLLGGPVYAWWGALLCAAVHLVAAREPLAERVAVLVLFTATGVCVHALALLVTLLGLRRHRAVRERGLGLLPLVGLLALLPLLQLIGSETARSVPVRWWGLETHPFGASLISSVVFAGWAVLGVHRLMRAELQLRNPPWAWLAFVGFAIAYAAGFVGPEARLAEGRVGVWRGVVAFAVGVACTYVAVFAESQSAAVFRRLFEFRRTRQRERLLDELPLWAATLPVVAAITLSLLAQPRPPSGLSTEEKQVAAGILLLLVRDLGLILGLGFGRDERRSNVAAVVCLVALYGLAPGLASGLGAPWAVSFLRSRADVPPLATLAPLAFAAAAAWLWAVARWRRASAGWPPPPAATREVSG
jgi:hypothetical protein